MPFLFIEIRIFWRVSILSAYQLQNRFKWLRWFDTKKMRSYYYFIYLFVKINSKETLGLVGEVFFRALIVF